MTNQEWRAFINHTRNVLSDQQNICHCAYRDDLVQIIDDIDKDLNKLLSINIEEIKESTDSFNRILNLKIINYKR